MRADLGEAVGDNAVLGFEVGADGQVCVPLGPGEQGPCTRIVRHDTRHPDTIWLADPAPAHPQVQSLPDGEVLVVGAMAEVEPGGTILATSTFVNPLAAQERPPDRRQVAIKERNALVYGPRGRLRRGFDLGAHVFHMQADDEGDLWVGYSDQGVFGFGEIELSWHGVVRYDRHGRQFGTHPAPCGFMISDCLKLVLADGAVWASLLGRGTGPDGRERTEALARIGSGTQADRIWFPPLRDARPAGVVGDRLLLLGGYEGDQPPPPIVRETPAWQSRFTVCDLSDPACPPVFSGRVVLPHGTPFDPRTMRWAARGSVLHVLHGTRWYAADLREFTP
jgi:hypothetical protein